MASETEHAKLKKALTGLAVEVRGIVGSHNEHLTEEGAQIVIDTILAADFDIVPVTEGK